MPSGANSAAGSPRSPGWMPGTDLSLAQILAAIRRRWKWGAAGVTGGVVAAVSYFLLAQPHFESASQLLVMRKDSRLPTAGVAAAGDSESKVSEDLLATHMQLLQSRRIVSEALAESGLDQRPGILAAAGNEQTPAEYVIRNLFVSRGGSAQARDAHVLNVSFRHISPEESQLVVQAVVDRYQRFLTEKFQDVNAEAAGLISKAREELLADLEKSEEEYQKFREQAPLLWNGDQSTNVHRLQYDQIQAALAELRLQMTDSRSRLELAEAAVAAIEKNGGSDLERLAVIDDKSAARIAVMVSVDQGQAATAQFQATMPERTAGAQTEYQSLLNLMVRERTLSQDFGAEHPEVRVLRSQIKEMQEFLARKSQSVGTFTDARLLNPKALVNAYLQLLRHDLAASERREKQLLAQAAQEEEAAKKLVSFELTGEELRKSVTRQQELYDAVVDRLSEINLAKDYGGFINEVIAPAELGKQVSPNLPISVAVGLFLGFVAGFAGGAAAESLDRSFRTSEEIQQSLGLPVLALIHQLDLAKRPDHAQSVVAADVLAYHRPRSREAELFRGIRTSLLAGGRPRSGDVSEANDDPNSSERRQVILLTSPNQGDGKSTVTANLAVSLAQTGRSVLLVDCDMRRPRVHTLFGVGGDSLGLSQALLEDLAPVDVVHNTEVDNLTVLPCGTIPSNPADLLSLPAFSRLLEWARQQYDLILLDCPPVLAVADPCIVAPLADKVLYVIRVTKECRDESNRAREMLQEVGADILGTVVNAWRCHRTFTNGYYGYGYGYGYQATGRGVNQSYYEDSPEKPQNGVRLARRPAAR